MNMSGKPDNQAASDIDSQLMAALRAWQQALCANVEARRAILLRAAASGRQ
jgi:hypothetical protein